MIKPYVCVACERVIIEISADEPASVGVASLIGLFSKMIAVSSDDKQQIPSNAVIPKEWAIFSAWDIESEDVGKNYKICTQMYYPDGSPFGEVFKLLLNTGPNKRSQNIVKMIGFPVGQAGFYKVQTWIEENDARVYGPIEFKIELEIRTQNQPQVSSGAREAH